MMQTTPSDVNWGSRKRRDLPLITPAMMVVLLFLRDAEAADFPFVKLDSVHMGTLKALTARYWMFASDGLDGIRYRITETGKRALEIYVPTLRRYDGMCPDCGVRPKPLTKSGRCAPYCSECQKVHTARKYAFKGKQVRPDSLCPRCEKRPRHVHPGGSIATYCTHCLPITKRRAKRRKRKQQLEFVKRGGFIKCRIKDCENPVHHTDASIYQECEMHRKEYMNAYNRKRRGKE